MAEAASSHTGGDPSRVPVLDGIRGLAILMVLLCHFSLYGGIDPATTADWIYFKLTAPLGCGVELFFVLSGFLITGILLDTKSAPGYFRSFYMRRVLRIFPLYYGTLFFFYVILPRITTPGGSYRAVLDAQAWDWAYLSNIRLALDGWWSAGYLGHFWSLAIEEQFYLAWPLLVLLCTRRSFLFLCAGLFGISVAIRWGQWIDGERLVRGYFTFARLDPLVTGAALAALARSPRGLAPLRPWAGIAGLGSLAALTYLITSELHSRPDHVSRLYVQTLYALVFGSLLLLTVTARQGSVLERVFSNRALIFLGVYSYGIYVFHHPLLVFAGTHGIGANLLPTVLGSKLPALAVVVAVGGAVTIAIAMLSYHLFEMRFLRMKRFFRPGKKSKAIPPRTIHGPRPVDGKA
jgi:peptidoglycan/LPS O-acetylase OafA/YrhL